jgi:SpoVK/Ycf46/Vps4 family AAA+-type ATPase
MATQALSRPEMDHGLSEQQVGEVTAAAAGYSCSDLAAVCRDAAMAPVRELMADSEGPGSDGSGSQPGEYMHSARLRKLQVPDFMTALARNRPSSEDHASYALP